MPPQLTDLVELARQAGAVLMDGYLHEHQVRYKSRVDLVTEVDHKSEKLVLDTIRQKFPGHAIVAEESGSHEGLADHCWYVDPLDGTLNFAHGLPIFAVSIAYAYQGQIQLGVVYDPTRDQCFRAEKGQGAWLGDVRLAVSSTPELIGALLVTGFPYDAWKNGDNNLNHFSHFSTRSQGVRRLGSAALDLCYVAAGWLDGFWEIRLSAWDVAAGALICSEAGGTVTDMQGQADFMRPPYSILAANPALHPLILNGLQEI
jgi:myo-inositol-1(or 4)-monophosphatase